MFPVFERREEDSKKKTQTIMKSFLTLDLNNNYTWWKEEISYLYIPFSQITEIKITPTENNTFNVYARIDLKDRFEYKLIDNRKTLAAAKKLAEDFVSSFNKNRFYINKEETIFIKKDNIVSYHIEDIHPNIYLIINDNNNNSWKIKFDSVKDAIQEIKNIISNTVSKPPAKKEKVQIEIEEPEKVLNLAEDKLKGLEPLAALMETLKKP
jgi:hypothetical protein